MKSGTAKTDIDPAALFNQLGRAVYGYALGVLADRSDAEEVVSETFLRICKRKQQYNGRGSLRAWVLSIAHRLCLDIIRHKAKNAKPVGLPEQLTSADPSPLAISQGEEKKEILKTAIGKLPAEQREVVMLKIYGDLTFREISQALGIPLNTALGRMHQALKHLSRNPSLSKMETE